MWGGPGRHMFDQMVGNFVDPPKPDKVPQVYAFSCNKNKVGIVYVESVQRFTE